MKPYLSIWTKPLETFKYLENRSLNGSGNHIEYLVALFLLISLSLYPPNTKIPIPADSGLFGYMLIIVIGPVVGLIVFYIFSYLFWRLGKILNGKATLTEIQLVLVYSAIPNLVHLVIALIFLIPALWAGNFPMILHQAPITYLVISLYTFRNLIYGFSYFNKFSYGYAVLNIVLLGIFFEALLYLIKH